MQNDNAVSNNEVKNRTSGNDEAKQYFITDENFLLLKQCQNTIFEKTEVSPAIRKIVNELISVENLEKVKSKFIGMLM
jgi:hypothetical protein